jgi:adenylyltransferase/sulfurtransferase
MPDDDILQITDHSRYDRFQLISWWSQEKLRAAKVIVVGAGALGNEVLKNLALLGVGNIFVIDFDAIENSNLSRSVLYRAADMGKPKAVVAAERVRDLNPDVKVAAHPGNVITDLGLGLFADADVVIGCLDNREARLWVNRSCWKVGTPWVDGGIQEISGVCKVFVPPDSACYECGMTENDYKLINLRYSCPLLRREDLLEGKVPTAPTISGIIAGMQTQEALKLIHGMPVAAGKAMVFNGFANSLYTTAYQRKDDCLSHETYPEPVRLSLDNSAMAETVFRNVEMLGAFERSDHGMVLELDRDLVTELVCEHCKTREEVYRPQQAVGMKQADCPKCGKLRKPVMLSAVEDGSWEAGRRLSELGVPPYDVVRVRCGEQVGVFLLADDGPRVWPG